VGIQTFWAAEGEPPRVLALEIAPVVALIVLLIVLTIKADVTLGYMRDTAEATLQPSIYAEGVLGALRASEGDASE
jgi:multicomponent K+:H+ antiporter subunit D